jgi:PAS domain S-box-containing protein
MIAASLPANESARLAVLASYSILDTTPEDAFDELARLASIICGTPIALVSLVDATRQWFKSHVGLDAGETPRSYSFCAYAIRQSDVFVVEDATRDLRFANNPLVTGDPHIRFYAGAVLTSPEGMNLGTLCVIDRRPRVLSAEQTAALRALAHQVVMQLELRRQITERSAAEERLRESEARLQRVLEGSNDGFWDWNIATGDVQYSASFASMLGYTLDELAPRISTMEMLVHPDDRQRVRFELESQLDGQTPQYASEHRMRHNNGDWLWLLARGKVVERNERGLPLRMAGTHTDISTRKRAERELDRFFDLSIDLLCIAGMDGTYKRLNPAFETVLGYSTAELAARPFIEFVHPDDREATLAELDALREGRKTVRFENRYVCRNGAIKHFAWTASPVPEEDVVYAAARDITDAKMAEEARLEVERMKGDFVSTVSHELRTPLTSIRGSLGILASGVVGELTPQAQQLVSVAERNSVRLIRLINDILDFEKLESGNVEMELRPTPLQRILERSVETISAFAEQEGIAIELHDTDAVVIADETRLGQVVVNLLSNAVKYSERGTRVTVSAHAMDGEIEVRVADHGRGIAASKLQMVFERFHQIDASDSRAHSGTGLGLAICKAIVEQHGGTIAVESREGEGSTFSFRVADAAEVA